MDKLASEIIGVLGGKTVRMFGVAVLLCGLELPVLYFTRPTDFVLRYWGSPSGPYEPKIMVTVGVISFNFIVIYFVFFLFGRYYETIRQCRRNKAIEAKRERTRAGLSNSEREVLSLLFSSRDTFIRPSGFSSDISESMRNLWELELAHEVTSDMYCITEEGLHQARWFERHGWF